MRKKEKKTKQSHCPKLNRFGQCDFNWFNHLVWTGQKRVPSTTLSLQRVPFFVVAWQRSAKPAAFSGLPFEV